ncbi:MAG: dipeptide epimerase [Thermoguttaceae bacterium]|nr:dipeptide epimerase [Thermoguttaceae bacterium]MDW8078868.1 enolase C-terminal domain-like protein [Thermoguttaceae bacterium]
MTLTLIVARLPLRHGIRHAAASYRYSDNIFVRCQLTDGSEGWGEGVPRKRLLGSSAEQLWQLFWSLPVGEWLPKPCGSWADVFSLCQNLKLLPTERTENQGFDHPLRCAVELAILDAFGRSWGQSVSQGLSAFTPAQSIIHPRSAAQYSATIMGAHPVTEAIRALFIRVWGFRHCKIKVGLLKDKARELRRLRRLRQWLGRRVDIRLDANGAWHADELPEFIEKLKPLGISCIEDPVPVEELPRLKDIRPRLAIPLMLDEPIVTKEDLHQAISSGYCDLINIRLSKCGGLLRSLEMAAYAHSNGIGFQLGCHPGESGILSAAGRHFATLVGQTRYVEGSYDRFLFRRLVTRENLTFGWGGWAPALKGPGLGVTVERSQLARWTIHQRTVAFF